MCVHGLYAQHEEDVNHHGKANQNHWHLCLKNGWEHLKLDNEGEQPSCLDHCVNPNRYVQWNAKAALWIRHLKNMFKL